MKIYHDRQRENIVIEGVDRYFSNGTLEAILEDGKISVRIKDTGINQVHLNYTQIQKVDGSPSGVDNADAITYLNNEFDKSRAQGQGNFTALLPTEVVVHDRIAADDVIAITPIVETVTNEVLVVTNVVDGGFTAARNVASTNGMGFRWRVV